MPVTDRRLIPRRQVKMPLRFRLVADPPARPDLPAGGSAPVLTGESLNLSERGVYFLTDRLVAVGAQIELFLPVAYDPAARSATELRCTARVVHCEAPYRLVRGEARPDTQNFRGADVGARPDTQFFPGIDVGARHDPSRTIGVGVFIECFDPPTWGSSEPVLSGPRV